MKKKNLLLFIPSIEGGGVEKNFYIIAKYLEKKHQNIELITTKKIKKKFHSIKVVNPMFNTEKLKSRKFKYFLCLYILLKKLILNRSQLVFAFQANIYCIIICKLFRVKVIIRSNSSPDGWSKNLIKSYIYKKIVSLADKVIVNSIELKRQFKIKFDINATCIFNPLNKNEILIKSKVKIKRIYKKRKLKLITVGRLVDQKNHITILKALKLIMSKIDFQLIIIGKGYLKNSLIEFINNNQLKSYVKILDFKQNPYPYIRQSEIFLLSSKYEGLPNVLLEAQVLKKYIISSNCKTGPKEILMNGKSGDLFKVNDYQKLAKLLIKHNKNINKNKKKIKIGYKNLLRYDLLRNLRRYDQTVTKYL